MTTEEKPKSGKGGDLMSVTGCGGDGAADRSAGDDGDIVFLVGARSEAKEVLRIRQDGVFVVAGRPVEGVDDRLVYEAFRHWLITAMRDMNGNNLMLTRGGDAP